MQGHRRCRGFLDSALLLVFRQLMRAGNQLSIHYGWEVLTTESKATRG